MNNTKTVSARLPLSYEERLQIVLRERSLGNWLQEILDDIERVQRLESKAKELENSIANAEAKLRAIEERLGQQEEVVDVYSDEIVQSIQSKPSSCSSAKRPASPRIRPSVPVKSSNPCSKAPVLG